MKAISLAVGSALLAVLSLVPVTQAAASGGPTPGEIQHWGAYFGDSIPRDADRQAWPTGLSFPDPAPVVQVGSSNAAQYALLADGGTRQLRRVGHEPGRRPRGMREVPHGNGGIAAVRAGQPVMSDGGGGRESNPPTARRAVHRF